VDEVTKVVQLYRLGTISNGYRTGANTFPFIDVNGNIRAVQVKQFDEQNHTISTDILHSIIEKHHTQNNKPLPVWLQNYTMQEKRISCLFGEHLLSKYPQSPVALVEAPKTAIYSTLYFGLPEVNQNLIWLAVYNKSSFSFDKLKVLQGRKVFVFPDLSKEGSTFSEWKSKSKEFERQMKGTEFIFSDLLEQLAPENDKHKGNDLADFLIKQDWRLFRKQNIQEQQTNCFEIQKSEASEVSEAPKTKVFLPVIPSQIDEVLKTEKLVNWSNEISELENYFLNVPKPKHPIKLNQFTTINDCTLFIESHIETVKASKSVIIIELNKAFKYDDMDIKDLMVASVDFTKENEYTMPQLVRLCVVMQQVWAGGDIIIPQNGNSNLAMSQHEEKIRMRNYNTARLHN